MILDKLNPYMLYIKIGALLALLGAGIYIGWSWRDYSAVKAEKKELAAAIKAKDEAIKAKDELQGRLNELGGAVVELSKRNNVIHTNTITKQYKEIEKPVYEQCIIPSTGVMIKNEAREGYNQQIRGELK